MLIYLFYNYYKYSESINDNSKKIFERNKNFICELAFQGQVNKKELCEICGINRYTLKIKIFHLSKIPNFSISQYPPYYSFQGDSIMILAVSEELFEQVKNKDIIIKKNNSFNLNISGKEYIFLSKENHQWLP